MISEPNLNIGVVKAVFRIGCFWQPQISRDQVEHDVSSRLLSWAGHQKNEDILPARPSQWGAGVEQPPASHLSEILLVFKNFWLLFRPFCLKYCWVMIHGT